MVVNVITRHAPTNYGSLLQAIATQRVIMNLGYECRIINYIPKCETGVRMAITQLEQKTKWRRNPIKKAIYLMVAEPETLLMDRKFLAMRKKYLLMGPCCATTGELKKLYAEKKDEVFLTGSDQVWGPISTGHYDPTYFLDFVPKSSRKLAFAASFGKAIFDEQTLKEYGALLKKYDSLAVRENVAVELLKKMDISAKQVLDPTLLLSQKDWLNSVAINPIKDGRYVLVYTLSGSRYIKQLVMDISKKLDCSKIIFIFNNETIVYENGNEQKIIIGPSEWVGLISDAEYVVTDSFHGTAFSINFNKPFTTLVNPVSNMNSRVMSILEITRLKDRIIYDDGKNRMPDSLIIDYQEVNKIMNEWRKKSIDFIKKALS